MAFDGKWKLVSSENVAEFSRSIGIAEDWIASKQGMNDPANDIVEQVAVTGDSVILTVFAGGQERNKQDLPIGKEVDHPGLDGRPAKMKVTVSGNSINRTQTGDGYSATYVRTVNGDNMTVVMTSNSGVKASRTFKRI